MTAEQQAAIQAMHDRWQRDMSGLETESLEDQIGICMSKDAEALGFFLGLFSTGEERAMFLQGFGQGLAQGERGEAFAQGAWMGSLRVHPDRRLADEWADGDEEVGTERDAGGA